MLDLGRDKLSAQMGMQFLASGLVSSSLGTEKGEFLGTEAGGCQDVVVGAHRGSFLIASVFSLKVRREKKETLEFEERGEDTK